MGNSAKVINVTIRFIPHPSPQQSIDMFARFGLDLYEKEIARGQNLQN
jgi:hypothetical protein